MPSYLKVTVPGARQDDFAAGVKPWLRAHVAKEATRAGLLRSVRILRSNYTGRQNEFLLVGEVEGPVGMAKFLGGDKAFAEFDAKVEELSEFSEIGRWRQPSA